MPFKSKAQMKKIYSLYKEGKVAYNVVRDFVRSTPDMKKLPDRLSDKQETKFQKGVDLAI